MTLHPNEIQLLELDPDGLNTWNEEGLVLLVEAESDNRKTEALYTQAERQLKTLTSGGHSDQQ